MAAAATALAVAADGSVVDGCIRAGAAQSTLAAAADSSVVDGCIRAGDSVDAKDDGAATAESEGAVDRMAAAATALAGAADGSVVDDGCI